VSSRARSNLAAVLTALAAGCITLTGAWTQAPAAAGDRVSPWQLQRSEDLVAKLCAHDGDPDLCAEAGRSQTGIRYVMTGRGPTVRWPQMAEPR
jgi:hypothetical protein